MTAKPAAWLLLGPETGEKDDFIRERISALQKETGAMPEVYKFYVPDTPCLEIVSLLKNQLLFSACKVVIIFNAESLPKNDAGLLIEYLAHPAPDALLFLCSEEIKFSPARLEERIGAAGKKIFWEMLEHQKRGWVRNFFIKRSLAIEDEALDFICEMVENNTRDLKTTCERLAVFFGKDAVIRYENIVQYIYHGKEENVFTLFAALVRRDFPLCLEILDAMLLSREEDAIRILSGLLWQLRNLARFFALVARGDSREQAFQKLAVRSKRQQKMYSDAQAHFSSDQVDACLLSLARFDTLCRVHNQAVHRLLLELFIYSAAKQRPLPGLSAWPVVG
jgi:DNA polymerase III subunit delta